MQHRPPFFVSPFCVTWLSVVCRYLSFCVFLVFFFFFGLSGGGLHFEHRETPFRSAMHFLLCGLNDRKVRFDFDFDFDVDDLMNTGDSFYLLLCVSEGHFRKY